jgi:hypothetical protein
MRAEYAPLDRKADGCLIQLTYYCHLLPTIFCVDHDYTTGDRGVRIDWLAHARPGPR